MGVVHASCVSVGGCGVLLMGPSGSGKSDLALRLIDGGAMLVADDQVALAAIGGRLSARPPPEIAGRIEVRGIGIVDMPHEAPVILGLAVSLEGEPPPRLPEPAVWRHDGAAIPLVALVAAAPSAAAKVRLAVRALWGDSAAVRANVPRDIGVR